MKAVSFKMVGITDVTIRNILQKASCEALGLYTAYFEIAKWQETYKVKATTGFMVKRTGWSKNKVIKYKKQLVQLGVLKDYKDVGEDGQVKGHYIEILHLVDDKPHSQKPEGGFDHGWKNETQVLSTGSLSAINKNKVLVKEEIKLLFDEIRIKHKQKLKGKARGLETEWKDFIRKHPKANTSLLEEMKRGAAMYFKAEFNKDEAFKYTPNFKTWYNQSRWEEYTQQ